MTLGDGRNFFRGAGGDDVSAVNVAALGAEIDDVVSGFHDFEVVLDNDDSIALIYQRMQDLEQASYVFEVQSRSRLIQDIERLAGCATRQFLSQLDPLRFSA